MTVTIIQADFIKNNCIVDFVLCNYEAGGKMRCHVDSPNCSPLVRREGEVTCALPRVEREIDLSRSLKIHSDLTRSSFGFSSVPQSVCSDNPPFINGGGDGGGDGSVDSGGDGGVTE
ncbi:MAG: hypothetical protein HRT44_08125 [Bdellovibrionales bacterium]|nr:hypothetical protein [Bdellovibrionales bacterium]NQZ19205.1 hypothetical protein [Bdellovibrionales bacterium]